MATTTNVLKNAPKADWLIWGEKIFGIKIKPTTVPTAKMLFFIGAKSLWLIANVLSKLFFSPRSKILTDGTNDAYRLMTSYHPSGIFPLYCETNTKAPIFREAMANLMISRIVTYKIYLRQKSTTTFQVSPSLLLYHARSLVMRENPFV